MLRLLHTQIAMAAPSWNLACSRMQPAVELLLLLLLLHGLECRLPSPAVAVAAACCLC
jgi:hypothetical protein